MSKYLYLIKNIGVLTLSNLGSKILAFLLIPLYTSVLSTEQYGVFDLAQTMGAPHEQSGKSCSRNCKGRIDLYV